MKSTKTETVIQVFEKAMNKYIAIISEEKNGELDKVTLSGDKLEKHFPKSYTPQQMEEVIFKLLDQWQKNGRGNRNGNMRSFRRSSRNVFFHTRHRKGGVCLWQYFG